jgi:outer membrane receptor protein involved in Fe transport
MSMRKIFYILLCLYYSIVGILAQDQGKASIKGSVIEKITEKPLEFASVVIKNMSNGSIIQGTVTDKEGAFAINGIPYGEYKLSYSFIGFENSELHDIVLNAEQNKIDVGKLYIAESARELNAVEVIGKRSTFVNSIDRKTYNVGKDLMSKSGSISDLMQNIPSLQVDIEGNVSLRGSESVTILINGKPSTMMELNRAAALQQIPANSVEKIEIITNPSAKYKPDGSSGIINIILKKNLGPGFSGNVSASAGNSDRYNLNTLLSNNSGKLNVYGSYGIRQDDRSRINNNNTRTYEDLLLMNSSKSHSSGISRPIIHITSAGIDYQFDNKNKVGASVNYNYRFMRRLDTLSYTLQNNQYINLINYDRDRILPETESDLEAASTYQYSFDKEGHELKANYIYSRSLENEDNYYTNFYRLPVSYVGKDNMFYHHINKGSELSVDYTMPTSKKSKIESGYLLNYVKNDMDLNRDTLSDLPLDLWHKDYSRSNHFIRTEYTHVLYATYEKEMGKFGYLAGLRFEKTFTNANLLTLDSIILNQYSRFYPTLHLSYKLTERDELQLNYSHRIRRPSDEQLNPFPEYQDLQNVRKGNPKLKPEDIHSFELGNQYKYNSITFISTLYYRYNYNGITYITANIGNNIFQNTLQNLTKSKSSGLELVFSTAIRNYMNINLSTNIFYNTIDASEFGYSKNKDIVSWSANASVGINFTRSTVLQINSNYSAKKLTPQGTNLPTFVLNTGFKQELIQRKATLTLTVSDVFNTFQSTYIIDTPDFYRKDIRKRSSRIIYLGFSYSFGNSSKKQKENPIKFDNQM